MRKGALLTKPLCSSFLSCEKDAETIIKKLFVTSQPYSNELKRLLLINTKDCLDNSNESYRKIVENTSVKDLMEGKYFSLVPVIKMNEHEEVKSYITLTFDDFDNSSNPEYRDFVISFTIICHTDYWELGDYKIRPLKIAGYIDGILNGAKLSGIGTLQFVGGHHLPINGDIAGYSLNFLAVHGNDDYLPGE